MESPHQSGTHDIWRYDKWKNLCTVYPRKSYFTVLFVVGRKEKESVEAILPKCTAFWKSGRTGNIFPQKPDHHIIIPRLVGKRAAGTVFEPFSAAFQIRGISRTVFLCIQRTVAEQAVKISHLLMAGKIFAWPVFKKTIRMFHFPPHFRFSVSPVRDSSHCCIRRIYLGIGCFHPLSAPQ